MGKQILKTFESKIKEKVKQTAFKKKETFDIQKYSYTNNLNSNLRNEKDLNRYFEHIELEKKKFQDDFSKKYNLTDCDVQNNQTPFNKSSSTNNLDCFNLTSLKLHKEKFKLGTQMINQCITETIERHNSLKEDIPDIKLKMSSEISKYFAEENSKPRPVFEKLKFPKTTKMADNEMFIKQTNKKRFEESLRNTTIGTLSNVVGGSCKTDRLEWNSLLNYYNNPFYFNNYTENKENINNYEEKVTITPILRKDRYKTGLQGFQTDRVHTEKKISFLGDISSDRTNEKCGSDSDFLDLFDKNTKSKLEYAPSNFLKLNAQSSKSLKKVILKKSDIKIKKVKIEKFDNSNVLNTISAISSKKIYKTSQCLPLINEEMSNGKKDSKKKLSSISNTILNKVKESSGNNTPKSQIKEFSLRDSKTLKSEKMDKFNQRNILNTLSIKLTVSSLKKE